MREVSWLAERPSASQDGLCCIIIIGLVSYLGNQGGGGRLALRWGLGCYGCDVTGVGSNWLVIVTNKRFLVSEGLYSWAVIPGSYLIRKMELRQRECKDGKWVELAQDCVLLQDLFSLSNLWVALPDDYLVFTQCMNICIDFELWHAICSNISPQR
jgi:hypothetical protein